MGMIVTKKLSISAVDGTSGTSGSSGVFTQSDKLSLELEMAFKTANLTNYKEFGYDIDNSLNLITIYENDTKAVTLFTKSLIYTNGNLSQTVLTRITDSAILTKDISYDINGLLESIEVS